MLLGLCESKGQNQDLAGFTFANAIGVAGKADITATGKRLTKSGIEAGMVTSGLGLPVGSYRLQVTAPGCESATLPLAIASGSTPVVVAYLDRKVDPQTRSVKNFIRLSQFPSEPQDSKYLIKVISVEATANFTANGSGQTQVLEMLKPAIFEGKTVKIGNPSGATKEVQVTNKGSYYCFVFQQADGKPGVSLALQRIYHW